MKKSAEENPYKIPLFDLDIDEEEILAVEKVLRSKWLTMGDVTAELEKAFSHFLDVPYCFAVCNGTAALHLAVMALGIEPGDEVICPALTFVATANAILYSGAKPVFADIAGKENFNISPSAIESKVSEKTKGIMVVHYAGFPCAMEEIISIASKHGLKVIEDAAHAPGAEFIWKNGWAQKVGGIGDIGCFSFFSNKNLSTGEGGMVATKDEQLAKRINTIRSHGMTSLTLDRYRGHSYSYDVVDLGYNYRIDEIRSAMGIVQLRKLLEKNERRKVLDALYRQKLRQLSDIEITFEDFSHSSAHHIFPILLPERCNRKTFMDDLRKNGIQTSVHYPPIHQFTYYRKLFGEQTEYLPFTEYVGTHEVTLPLYPSLTEEDVDYIVLCVQAALEQSTG